MIGAMNMGDSEKRPGLLELFQDIHEFTFASGSDAKYWIVLRVSFCPHTFLPPDENSLFFRKKISIGVTLLGPFISIKSDESPGFIGLGGLFQIPVPGSLATEVFGVGRYAKKVQSGHLRCVKIVFLNIIGSVAIECVGMHVPEVKTMRRFIV